MSLTGTPTHEQVLNGDGTKVVAALQAALPTLIDLALDGKQLHWNVRGGRFKSVHEQLDELINDVRMHSDEVAERITTLGVAADGRATMVASDTKLEALSTGFLNIEQVVNLVVQQLIAAVKVCRDGQTITSEIDPVTEDLLIGIIGSLEKHLWMFKSQLESA